MAKATIPLKLRRQKFLACEKALRRDDKLGKSRVRGALAHSTGSRARMGLAGKERPGNMGRKSPAANIEIGTSARTLPLLRVKIYPAGFFPLFLSFEGDSRKQQRVDCRLVPLTQVPSCAAHHLRVEPSSPRAAPFNPRNHAALKSPLHPSFASASRALLSTSAYPHTRVTLVVL
jgi:hypothetical protein